MGVGELLNLVLEGGFRLNRFEVGSPHKLFVVTFRSNDTEYLIHNFSGVFGIADEYVAGDYTVFAIQGTIRNDFCDFLSDVVDRFQD